MGKLLISGRLGKFSGLLFYFYIPADSVEWELQSNYLVTLRHHIRILQKLTKFSPPSIISYVLLCGYSPFRSEDVKELVRETTEAKIEFHERYWKNVSQQAKVFIKSLLNADPAKRPTVDEASNDPVRFHFLTISYSCFIHVLGDPLS